MDKIKTLGRGAGVAGFLGLGVTSMLLMLAGPASAAADPVADAFTTMEGKVTTYGAAIVALVVLAVAIFLGIKYLRKGLSNA